MLALPWILAPLLSCRSPEPPPLNVVVVVIDGVRIDDSYSPEISELSGEPGTEGLRSIHSFLAPQGTLIRGVRNTGTTTTAPAHSILMTGHHSRLANFANDTGAGSYRPTRPSWIEALREAYGDEAMVMANQSLIEPMSWSIHPEGGEALGADFVFVPEEPGSNQPAGNDAPVFAQLKRTLALQHPRWVLVNLKAVDRTGHYATTPEGYLNAIRSVDQPIVELWESLQMDPFYANNTVLIITSDHGRDREGQGDGTSEYWRNHGNASAGNRDIPLILIGPGVHAGLELEGAYGLQDIAPTIAALTGVELPWATGLPIAEALEVSVGPQREGVGAVSASQSPVRQVWLPETHQRSQILVGDTLLSDPQALAAEAPTAVDLGQRTWACWRELRDEGERVPWTPHCALLQGEQVIDQIIGPSAEVSPFWRPALHIDAQERLCLSAPYNPDDVASAGLNDSVAIHHSCWNGSTWVVGINTQPQLRYPELHTAAILDDGQVVLPLVASPPNSDARNQRRVYLQLSAWGADGWTMEDNFALDLSAAQPLTGTWRHAWPTLMEEQGTLKLLVLAHREGGVDLIQTSSKDGGRVWSRASVVASSPEISLDLPPQWVAGAPAWIQGTQICNPSGCEDLGGRVADWRSDGETLRLVVETAPGMWEIVER